MQFVADAGEAARMVSQLPAACPPGSLQSSTCSPLAVAAPEVTLWLGAR
jgi:hypothetical protein